MATLKDKHFAKFLKDISKELKEVKPVLAEETFIEIIPEETTAERVAKYLSTSQQRDVSISARSSELIQNSTKAGSIPAKPENIEQQRWNDPLRKEPGEKFVTFKEMNDHYTLFLSRIQQQLSTAGGGGEVRFSRLDDVNASGASVNKFLTYDTATKKYKFDFLPVGDGLQLSENPGIISTKTSSSFGYEPDGTMTINPASTTTLGGIKPGGGFTVGNTGVLSLNAGPSFFLDENNVFGLRPGTSTQIGGIKAGPGIAIDPDGTLFIDTEGLPFTFGDFTGLVGTYPEGHPKANTDYALLGSINLNEDIVIASSGSGSVRVVGEFEVYAPNGDVNGALIEEPFFKVKTDGQVRILTPTVDALEGAVEIVGSSSGIAQPPVNSGVMLHITGNNNIPSRLYVDGVGGYAGFVGRRFNGLAADPTQILAGDEVTRLAANAYKTGGWSGVGGSNIRFISTDNQTNTAQGMKIDFYSTPQGQSTANIEKTMTVEGGVGVTATRFVGPLTGTADTATNLTAATNILAGALNIDLTIINKNSTVVQTFTLAGLTTNHKVMVMPQAALPNNLTIISSWASATNTLSIQLRNDGGAVDPVAFNLAYFAWI
jgi:hypothetical protein